MGLSAPQSSMEVRDDLSFLDLTVMELQEINEKYQVDVPLVLMNSFYTKTHTIQNLF